MLYLGSIDTLKKQHHAALLDIGENSLKARLHLIRSAKRSIDFQNFLFRRDQTGDLVIHELVQAARRGVRVRILFDQLFTVSELNYLAGLSLEHRNFDVRLYNPIFNRAKTTRSSMFGSVTCCFTKTNQRMHSKLQVTDEVVGLTGGRNSADRYFDLDTDYDFKDREVLVCGPVAREMHAKSFVIDGRVSMVGSHNLDPRGEDYNTENGVIIYDRAFAAELERSIRKDIRPGNSWVAVMKPPQPPVLGEINGAIESVSRSLPSLDIWPYRSTTLFELRPGALSTVRQLNDSLFGRRERRNQ